MTDLVDEVALERASRGDRGVWQNLTRTERRLAMTAARERRLAELAENAEWRREVLPHVTGTAEVLPHVGLGRCPEWLARIVSAAGYGSCETFMKAARRMAKESG